MDLKKLYDETNEKFVERMENLLYFVNGCDIERGRIVLEMCIERNKKKGLKIKTKKV